MSWLAKYPTPQVPDGADERRAAMRDAARRLAETKTSGGELISLRDSISEKATDTMIQRLQKAYGKR